MLPLVLFMTLLGGVLGLRFKVFVLVPVIGAAWLFIAVAGKAFVAPQTSVVMVIAAVGAAVQIGYLLGLLTRYAIAAARLPSARVAPTTLEHQS